MQWHPSHSSQPESQIRSSTNSYFYTKLTKIWQNSRNKSNNKQLQRPHDLDRLVAPPHQTKKTFPAVFKNLEIPTRDTERLWQKKSKNY